MTDRAVARSTDPSTSWEAAASVTSLRVKQLEVLALLEEPMNDEKLVAKARACDVKQSVSGIRTRRSELVELGLVRDTGRRIRTASNRQSIVWEALI